MDATGDPKQLGQPESKDEKAKEVADWADIAFYGEYPCSLKTVRRREKSEGASRHCLFDLLVQLMGPRCAYLSPIYRKIGRWNP